jgi:hypothetical protein
LRLEDRADFSAPPWTAERLTQPGSRLEIVDASELAS